MGLSLSLQVEVECLLSKRGLASGSVYTAPCLPRKCERSIYGTVR